MGHQETSQKHPSSLTIHAFVKISQNAEKNAADTKVISSTSFNTIRPKPTLTL